MYCRGDTAKRSFLQAWRLLKLEAVLVARIVERKISKQCMAYHLSNSTRTEFVAVDKGP